MKPTTRDNFIYLGVGLTVAAAFVFYVFYTDKIMGRIPEIPGPILWGIISTPVIVALLFEEFWTFRRCRSLWVVIIVAALTNVLAMFIAYSYRWNPTLIVWSTMTAIWIIVVRIAAQYFVTRSGTPQKSKITNRKS